MHRCLGQWGRRGVRSWDPMIASNAPESSAASPAANKISSGNLWVELCGKAAQAQGPCKASEGLTTCLFNTKFSPKSEPAPWSPYFADSEPYLQQLSWGRGSGGGGNNAYLFGFCKLNWVSLLSCGFFSVVRLVFSSRWGLSVQSLLLCNIRQHRTHPGFCEGFRDFPEPSQLPRQRGVTV